MRIWGRVALGGFAVLTSSFVITIPAGAAQSHPGGVSDTCPEVVAGAPTGGVEKVTVPVDGSEVRRGAVVAVTLRWDVTTFTSPVLHKALDCVTVDGALAAQPRSRLRWAPAPLAAGCRARGSAPTRPSSARTSCPGRVRGSKDRSAWPR